MRSWLVTAALGLAAIGLTTLTPATAGARPPRVFVGVYSPGVTVTYGPYGGYYAPSYYAPAPVVVPAYSPYAVGTYGYYAPAPVVTPYAVPSYPVMPYTYGGFYARPRVYYSGW